MSSVFRAGTRRCVALLAMLVGVALSTACGTPDTPPQSIRATDSAPAPDLRVTVRTGALSVPATVRAGWQRMLVEEDGAGHIVVAYRLPAGATDDDVPAFLAALDTSRGTPSGAVALGGPEIGDTGVVIIPVTEGRYVVACLRRGEDGHRHGTTGEMATFVAVASDAADSAAGMAERSAADRLALDAPPVATQQVGLVDFAFTGDEQWAAGPQLIRIENIGPQDHQVRIDRLRDGATLRDLMTADEDEGISTPVVGMARMSAGTTAYLPVDLAAGTYAIYCLVPEAVSGTPHVDMGMMRQIIVR